jgi:hypothetical protein
MHMPSNSRGCPYKDFVKRNFQASWELELFLQLHGTPRKQWRVEELATEMGIDAKTIALCLDRLLKAKLVELGEARGSFAACVQDTETRRLAELMTQDFQRNRLSVLRILYS